MTPGQMAQHREDRLNEVLLAYVEACEAGEQPDRERILASHPDLGDDLALFFSERDRLERLGGQFQGRERMPTRMPSPPEVVAPEVVTGRLGDFRIVREVGRGGMGTVFEAVQISLNRRVALKILPFASALDPRQLQRFKNEAAAAANLRHENIVAVHAIGCERGVHYFAMEFVEGQSLAAFISEQRQTAKRKPDDSTLAIGRLATARESRQVAYFDWVAGLGRQAALALEHAHETGVVHRDVKPGNLLLDTRGHLWVADFGLAQIASDVGLTVTGELLGTLRYASPEQTRGRRGLVDQRSDIYSLGATLFELLTQRPPFDATDRHELLQQVVEADPPLLRSLVADAPESLETIIAKTLRKDPADRYATAQELADDLKRFVERRPILARPPRLAEQFWAWTRRHPTLLLASVLTLACVTIGSVLIAVLVGAERERTQAAHRRAEGALRAERQRAEEAESRLGLAQRAVDELLRISDEELADRPEMLFLHQRVLRSALTFHEEFLKERRHDSHAQRQLLETTQQIERILADLKVLRSAAHFYLLCQPAVLTDLGIRDDQRPRLHALTDRVGREWWASFRDFGVASPTERARRMLDQARANEASLSEILTAHQQTRLQQIGLQSEGAAAFRDLEVAAEIGLSPEQREQIRVIEDGATYGWIRGPHRDLKTESTDGLQTRTPSPNERIMEVLTEAQIRKWRALTGDPVDGLALPFKHLWTPKPNRERQADPGIAVPSHSTPSDSSGD